MLSARAHDAEVFRELSVPAGQGSASETQVLRKLHPGMQRLMDLRSPTRRTDLLRAQYTAMMVRSPVSPSMGRHAVA